MFKFTAFVFAATVAVAGVAVSLFFAWHYWGPGGVRGTPPPPCAWTKPTAHEQPRPVPRCPWSSG